MRALCVGRHQYLSDHLSLYFRDAGLDTVAAVGLDGALAAARTEAPEIVLCDYDLLVSTPLDQWEQDEIVSRIPIIAVSLTRRPTEVHLLDINGIAGFLYLPKLDRETVRRVIGAASRSAAHCYSPISPARPLPTTSG
jgi:DNA-binding response OmpR family regulator